MSGGVEVSEHETRATSIAGLVVITPRFATDARGTVRELFRASTYLLDYSGSVGPWRQINLTATQRGAVRGLHGEAMNKLVTVATGKAFGVYVDARKGSSTAGSVVTVDLVPGTQVFVPTGVCNGFQAVADGITEYLYFFDSEWHPGMPGTSVTPLDPALGVTWPIAINAHDPAQISNKDASAPSLSHVLT